MMHGSVSELVMTGKGVPPGFENTIEKIRCIVDAIKDSETPGRLLLNLDQYSLILAMLLHRDPRLTPETCSLFFLRYEMLIKPETLFDPGPHLRSLCVFKYMKGYREEPSLFLRLLDYSLPFSKHNRLHFPALKECSATTLAHVVQLMMATCLGLYETCERRPVWVVRVRVWFFFWNLLLQGTPADLHVFCLNRIPLVKLAIIEYFFYSLKKCMPVENNFILSRESNGQRSSTEVTSAIAFHIDQFRQACLRDDEFNLTNAVTHANAALEKCVRLWKARIPTAAPEAVVLREATRMDHPDLYKVALASPVMEHPFYIVKTMNVSTEIACAVHELHQRIQVYALPLNVMRQQYAFIEKALRSDSFAVSKLLTVHVCLKCGLANRARPFGLDRKMRIGCSGTVVCGKCCTDSTVASISMVGRIVNIFGTYYYFCWRCRVVHTWNSDGTDLIGSCRQCLPKESKTQQVASGKSCMLCERRSQVEQFSVLDDTLGILSKVPLCPWHTPSENHRNLVYNFESLIAMLREKHRQIKKNRK